MDIIKPNLPAFVLTAATRIVQHAEVKAVVLFGSRASLRFGVADDWDMAVVMRGSDNWPSKTMMHLKIADVLATAHLHRISQEDLYASATDSDHIAHAISCGIPIVGSLSLPVQAVPLSVLKTLKGKLN